MNEHTQTQIDKLFAKVDDHRQWLENIGKAMDQIDALAARIDALEHRNQSRIENENYFLLKQRLDSHIKRIRELELSEFGQNDLALTPPGDGDHDPADPRRCA